jgi:hypothetical protein
MLYAFIPDDKIKCDEAMSADNMKPTRIRVPAAAQASPGVFVWITAAGVIR